MVGGKLAAVCIKVSWNMRGEEFKCGVTEMEDKLRSAEQKVEKVRVPII